MLISLTTNYQTYSRLLKLVNFQFLPFSLFTELTIVRTVYTGLWKINGMDHRVDCVIESSLGSKIMHLFF